MDKPLLEVFGHEMALLPFFRKLYVNDPLKWGLYGTGCMALSQTHKSLFEEECSRLTILVCDCLKALERDPSDFDSIERMVNAADVIRGGARFLQDGELEQGGKMLIELFKGVQDVRERQKEFEMVRGVFQRLACQGQADQVSAKSAPPVIL